MNKIRGARQELKVIKKLKELGFHGLKSSRSESKNLDNDLIDIADVDNVLPCYVQVKATIANPQYHRIITDCPRKEKPMVIFHNKQYKIDGGVKQQSQGEYFITTSEFGYELLRVYALYNKLIEPEEQISE